MKNKDYYNKQFSDTLNGENPINKKLKEFNNKVEELTLKYSSLEEPVLARFKSEQVAQNLFKKFLHLTFIADPKDCTNDYSTFCLKCAIMNVFDKMTLKIHKIEIVIDKDKCLINLIIENRLLEELISRNKIFEEYSKL